MNKGDQQTRSIEVRRLDPADEPAWRSLWRQYQAFYEESITEATTRVVWRRMFDAVEPVVAFVANEGGEVAGFVHALTHRSFWTIGDYCYLQDLFVAPASRKRGIASALIAAIGGYAVERQCSRVYWLTQETNRTAQRLYDCLATKTGFIQYVQNTGVEA